MRISAIATSALCAVAGMLLLSGCQAQSKIQSSYIRQQNTCRDEAQEAVENATAANPAAAADPANSLAVRFSECMNKAGWHVAVPKTPGAGTPVAQNPNAPPPDALNPSFPPAISASVAAPAAAPKGSAPSAPAAPAPASVAAPVAATVAAPTDAPATYQPVLPAPAPDAGYGAGRQF